MMLGSQSARAEQTLERPGKKSINVGQTERWISMAAGAALAIYGLTRESMTGKAALSLTGGYLFYRGQTGYSAVSGDGREYGVGRKRGEHRKDHHHKP